MYYYFIVFLVYHFCLFYSIPSWLIVPSIYKVKHAGDVPFIHVLFNNYFHVFPVWISYCTIGFNQRFAIKSNHYGFHLERGKTKVWIVAAPHNYQLQFGRSNWEFKKNVFLSVLLQHELISRWRQWSSNKSLCESSALTASSSSLLVFGRNYWKLHGT